MKQVHLLLGGNLGEREKVLNEAKKLIIANLGQLIKQSALYETAAWGKENQAPFLNQVLLINTPFNAHQLLALTQEIENQLGRVRFEKWGERLIDIDILFIEDEVIESDSLKIPHPFIQDRRFTLVPLHEVSPDFVHPVLNKTLSTLLAECSDTLEVKIQYR